MSNTTQSELDAILHRAAIATLNDRAFLRITGSDATRWLNGMVTNSIQSLAPGEGCYNFLLNSQGRIQADCTIYRDPAPEPASYLLATDASQLETIQQHLDHFIIMDDVELQPALRGEQSLLVLGPKAPQALQALGLPTPSANRLTIAYISESLIAILTSSIEDRFELRADPDTIAVLRKSAGLPEVSPETLEALRILEARPLYGRDITEKYLPQETNQPQALHFSKGCYLGQEIVERIRSRGQVHRVLTQLTLHGQLPADLPATLESGAKPVGEITSAALVPLPEGPQLLALGYVRREALEGPQAAHKPLTYNGGTATPRTTTDLTEPSLTTNDSRHEDTMPDKTPFVINDRRKFTSEGELRPDAPHTEREPEPPKSQAAESSAPEPKAPIPFPASETLKHDAQPSETAVTEALPGEDHLPPPPTAEQTAQATRAYDATVDRLDTAIRATNPGMERAPEMNYERLVQSLYMQALFQLGGAAEPGQTPQVDLLGARQTIDMLTIIAAKTTGNLSDAEAKLTQSALFELRMGFLEITQALARQAARPPGTPGAPTGPSIVR